MACLLTHPALFLRLPRTLQVLAMTKGEGLAVTIRVAKRLQLLLLLVESFFLGKCLCALTYLVSSAQEIDHSPQAHKENADADRGTPMKRQPQIVHLSSFD
jgi:hypothetical protein